MNMVPVNINEYQQSNSIKDKLISLKNKLKEYPSYLVKQYTESIIRDIKRGDGEQYNDMSVKDMVEDFINYMDDKE